MIRIYIESLITILIITTICIDRSSCNRTGRGPDCRRKLKEPAPPIWPPLMSSSGLSLNRPNQLPMNRRGQQHINDVILRDKNQGRGRRPNDVILPDNNHGRGRRPNDVILPDNNQGRGRRPNDVILPDNNQGRGRRPNDVILPDKNQGRGRRPNDVILPDKNHGRGRRPNDVILPDKNQGRGRRPNDVILPDKNQGRGRKKSFTEYLNYLFITGQFDKFREAIRNAVPWARPRPKNKKIRPNRFIPQ